MKLFLVERTDGFDYDEHDAAVVRAESEEEVRTKLFTLTERGRDLVRRYGADELRSGHNHYGLYGFREDHVKVTELTGNGEPGVVLASFNAG